MNLTPEESRLLRREVHGKGNLAKLGLITVTDAGRGFVATEDERIKRERLAGAKLGPAARMDAVGPRRRRQIAKKAGEKSAQVRRERKQAHDETKRS